MFVIAVKQEYSFHRYVSLKNKVLIEQSDFEIFVPGLAEHSRTGNRSAVPNWVGKHSNLTETGWLYRHL